MIFIKDPRSCIIWLNFLDPTKQGIVNMRASSCFTRRLPIMGASYLISSFFFASLGGTLTQIFLPFLEQLFLPGVEGGIFFFSSSMDTTVLTNLLGIREQKRIHKKYIL